MEIVAGDLGTSIIADKSSQSSIASPKRTLAYEIEMLRWMISSRSIDRLEMELITRGEAFFHVGAAGHEGAVALHKHLKAQDWLHLHYRDKALMLARGIPVEQFFHSLLCTEESHSAGRQMSAHLSAAELNILSLVGPVGNNALQAVGVAKEIKLTSPGSLVLCSVGDGTSQEGEFLEAIAEAVRAQVPCLFWVEDNGYSISTPTKGQTFYNRPNGAAKEFYGMPIHRLPGSDVLACSELLGPIIEKIRADSQPALVVFEVERLTHHTNADDERVYRSEEERKTVQDLFDPIEILKKKLIKKGVPELELEQLARGIEDKVRTAANNALTVKNPKANLDARPSLPTSFVGKKEYTGSYLSADTARFTMLEAMREVLKQRLSTDSRVCLFGEDIEDPKGDVFGLTKGLSKEFPERVVNSALSESTIVGTSIGRALAGAKPIAFIQFADFLPIAFNQIASELGSMHWRTNGSWKCPVIIMVPCGGYRPGLGPFHAQSFESVMAHVPGVDVYMPSNAGDAAGMLNAAFDSDRPTIFYYPKALLNDRARTTSVDVSKHFVMPGKAKLISRGDDLTLVAWGATVGLCTKAADALTEVGISCEIIDLRSISPWDKELVLASVKRTKKLIVVHEDNSTCGLGAEVIATVSESLTIPVLQRRVTRQDTYIPCNYENQLEVLPSFEKVLGTCCELLELNLSWREREEGPEGTFQLEAIGLSPADQQVTVLDWLVREGEFVTAGAHVAECEADKASFDLRAPVEGRITNLFPKGKPVKVGSNLAQIINNTAARKSHRIPKERIPLISKKAACVVVKKQSTEEGLPTQVVLEKRLGIGAIHYVTGSQAVSNEDILKQFPDENVDRVLQGTGITQRFHCVAGENALSLAKKAALTALKSENLKVSDLDAIFVSTSTPISLSPSMACLLHYELLKEEGTPDLEAEAKDLAASDIYAACTGWLYALQSAFDFAQQVPNARILIVSAEHMSRFLKPGDFETAFVFGDAATATIVRGPSRLAESKVVLHRPVLSAQGEDGSVLSIGKLTERDGDQVFCAVEMQGTKVFPLAVRQMGRMLRKACTSSELEVTDLDWIVPHQANGRIISAMQKRTGISVEKVVSNISNFGNTSSSSIPIALSEVIASGKTGKVGLCAFGGGFTFGAAIAEVA